MKRIEQVMRFQADWLSRHPEARDIIVNRDRPIPRRLRRPGEEGPEWESLPHLTMSQLITAFGASFMTVIRMLYEAQVQLYVMAGTRGQVISWRILESDFPKLWKMHGTEAAFEARRSRPTKLKGPPLPWPCERCGKTGRQFRHGHQTAAGSQNVRCGHCNRCYTHNKTWQPHIETPCQRCGAKGRQRRSGKRPCGSQTIRCLHCRKYYTIRQPESSSFSSSSSVVKEAGHPQNKGATNDNS